MKVLQINAVYGYGSTGIIMRDIQECAAQNGINAYVAFPVGFGETNAYAYEIGHKADRKMHALLCRIAGKQGYFSSGPTKILLQYIDRLRPDIVHLHNLHSNYIHVNLLLKYLAARDIRTIVSMHDCWYLTGGCFHYASIGCDKWQTGCGQCPKRKQDTPALLYDASARILGDRRKYLTAIKQLTMVGVSEWIAAEAKKSVLREKNILTIHNGIDLTVFRPRRSDLCKRLGIEGKFVLLGPAGKWLLPINRPTLDYFVRQMSPDTILLLFGGMKPVTGLPKQVMFYGYTRNREELAMLYSMADVMVNCSREDTLSSLNLEAQACGTPIVTYDATGSRETVDGQCGFAVETGNHEALWNAVLTVRYIGKNRLGEACRQWIAREFEKKSNYVKYIELYKQSL